MSGFLLDTSVAIWALREPDHLSPAVIDALRNGPNHLSVLSYWEVLLKTMKGKLEVGDPRLWWARSLDLLVAVPLALQARHIEGIQSLRGIHRDPFDRALIATATVESLTLLTTDKTMIRYASRDLRIII